MNDLPVTIFTMIVIAFQLIHIRAIWNDGEWWERGPKQEII